MDCVVCKRRIHISKRANSSKSRICAACKASFYRSLKILHIYLEKEIFFEKNPPKSELLGKTNRGAQTSQSVNESVLKIALWEYLSNREFCKRKSQFLPGAMCKIVCSDYDNLPCQHCRFRKTVVGMEHLNLLSRTSLENVDNRSQFEIVHCLETNSKRILEYCRFKLRNSIKSRKFKNSSENISKTSKVEADSRLPDPRPEMSNVSLFSKKPVDFKITMNHFEFYTSPLSRANSKLSDLATKDWMQPHLHNRCVKIEEDKNKGGFIDWLSDNNGYTPFTYDKRHLQFQCLDKDIFNELLKSVFIVQLAETSIPFSVKIGLKAALNEVVTSTLKHFHHVMAFLRILASENDKKQIVYSPHAKTFVTRTMFFQKLTILYGIDNAERVLKMYVCLLVQMKELSSYRLMILYLLVCVSIIDESILENIPEQIRAIIQGFKIKIESLSSKLGLDNISRGVIRWAKLYKQSVSFGEGDKRLVFSIYNFDVCDEF